MKRQARFLAVVVCFSFLSAPPLFAQELKTLKVGYIPIVSLLPFFAALNNGYFDAEGLKIEPTLLESGPLNIRAVAGGSLAVGYSTYYSIFPAREAGIDLVIIAPGLSEVGPPKPYGGALLVLADSAIKGAKDLERRNVAVGALKSLDWVTIAEWMTKYGADPNKVAAWVEVPYPAMGVALRSRAVDVMITTDPFLTVEEAQGGVRKIANVYSEIDPKMPIAGWIATESWLKKGDNRQVINRFVRAYQKGVEYVNTQREKRGEILAKYTRIKPELASRLSYYPNFDLTLETPGLQGAADLALKWGLITKKINVQQIVLPGVLR